MKAGKLDRRVIVLHPVETRDAVYGSVALAWHPLEEVWAEVQDLLPSRGERIAEGIAIARRPCRVRMRWMPELTSAMRLDIDGRVLRIVAGPIELGREEGIELVAEELSSEGQDG